jgi:hypothetical protein
MNTDLASLAKAFEQCRAKFYEIDRDYDALIRRIVGEGAGSDPYADLEVEKLWNDWRAAYDAMEDADLTFHEAAVKPHGLPEDHPIMLVLKRRREALARRRRPD